MAWYRYRAREADGTWFTSTIEAESAYEATVAVREMGVELDALERVASPEPEASSSRSPSAASPSAASPVAEAPAAPDIGSDHRLEPVDDRPPPAPRPVPSGTSGVAGGIVFMMVGGLFTAIASIFIVIGLGVVLSGDNGGWFFAAFPMIHLSVGLGLLTYALRGRSERRRIVAEGHVALGRIESTGRNRRVKINGRNPYKMDYEFEVDGRTFRGSHSTMDEAIKAHRLHDRIWVLYDPADPSKNVEWPPF